MKNLTYLFLWTLFVLQGCQQQDTLFTLLSPEESGVHFSNIIYESDSVNILVNEYIYNGGGVAVADVNRDGLMDLYFSGNMVPNHLYLNRGNLNFEEVGALAGVQGGNRWTSGVAVVDINTDGWPDFYVCATNRPQASRRKNMLFVHQGLDEQGIPHFEDMADAYGLADTSHTTMAAFFDYDNDGDLDVYLAVNEMDEENMPNRYREKITDGTSRRTDKLYRNEWDDARGHPVFSDVSREAGIRMEGFSLGLNIVDINRDGWKDIFVTNDYLTNDLLYINNGDGTFTDRAGDFFKHTSHSAMGNDVVDINNDGMSDVIVVDMLPEDNYRRKTMLQPNNYFSYLRNDQYGYHYQYVRNTFQVSLGTHPETGSPLYSDLSMFSGISATDWSWTPLVADFDNDGFRDVIITNGFPRDITDQDFVEYQTKVHRYATPMFLRNNMPSIKIPNYAYRNQGGLSFKKVTGDWGMDIPSFSNGAIYADLDNDGDLEVVVNNINDSAFVFNNQLIHRGATVANWLRVKLEGPQKNPEGYGAIIELSYGADRYQMYEVTPFRGYLSSVEPLAHFGLDTFRVVHTLTLTWPDGKRQRWEQLPGNQVVAARYADAGPAQSSAQGQDEPWLRDITAEVKVDFKHEERDHIDFNIQPLLPHKLSQFGPGMAVGDVNGDGLDDLYLSGPAFHKGTFFVQAADGTFSREDLLPEEPEEGPKQEELGVLFFDADQDGDQDLYLVSGGYEGPAGDSLYQDRLMINEGGQFVRAEGALPACLTSGSKVTAADYDRDGDLDLLVAGRVFPHEYPRPVSSHVLKNESKPGHPRFEMEAIPALDSLGMVSDALWTDFDQDGWVDLLLAGEWMPLTFLKNEGGHFQDITARTGLAEALGWWNSLAAGDFDRDGDIDYIAGNLGLNTLCRANPEQPLAIYAKDFDGNGGYDAIPTLFFPNLSGEKEEFPFFGRGDMQKQSLLFKKHFERHADFARADMDQILPDSLMEGVLVRKANHMESSWVENRGDGTFRLHPLPLEAQVAPVFGMLVDDLDADGWLDVLVVGNDYGTEVSMGRYDASYGLVLRGQGKEGFKVLNPGESGLYVPGDAKSLVRFRGADNSYRVAAAENRGPLRIFSGKQDRGHWLALGEQDFAVKMVQEDGRSYRLEFPQGTGFLSQSAKGVWVPAIVSQVEVTDYHGRSRILFSRHNHTTSR